MPEPQNQVTNNISYNFLQGGGEMGSLMRAYPWQDHPLGKPESWPQSLQTNIRLLLNSNFPMFIWWSEDFYMFHNDAYLPALGKKHPEALGASAREMWSEIWYQLGIVAEGIMQDARPFYAENLPVIMDRKGFMEETYWTFSYSPVFNDAGEVEGIFCACFEVTNSVIRQRRLKTLKDISDATAQIQTLELACQSICDILIENENDIPFSMIYLLDGTGTIAILLGMAGDVRKKATPSIIDLTQLEASDNCPFAKVVKTREKVVIESTLEKAFQEDDTAFTQVVVHPVFNPGEDKVIGFFISGINPKLQYDSDYQNFHEMLIGKIATSITILQAREGMVLQQKYLQSIFEQAPVGITILRGSDYIIDLANPQVCEIWGRQREDVLGKPVLEALPEISDQGIKTLLDKVVSTGQPFIATELPLALERNGQLETVQLNFLYHPMRDTRGQVTGVIAVAIDITEQVSSRHEIEAINRQLLTINADLDNFVYSASHDLKAPISNIEGLMIALEDYLPAETLNSEMVQQLIGMIKTSIERFKRAVGDLTEVARLERESGEDITFVNLPEIIADVSLDFAPIVAETGARIENNLGEDAIIKFSAKNIRSIIYNLLSNALKYRSPDRTPHIRFSTETTDGYTILSVADNGLGIDMSEKNKIFSMFKRLHDHVEGTGVGLYIVKKIVENAGGSIDVESKVGEGTVFKINFKH